MQLAPQSSICLPLVLPEPSVAYVDIRPSASGLVLSLLAEAGQGTAVLTPVALAMNASPIEMAVPGSGVYAMEVRNSNFLTAVSFWAKVEHEPTAERNRSALKAELSTRKQELHLVEQQEAELELSEAALAQRLWEVQETRRRHQAVRSQLIAAVEHLEHTLAAPLTDTNPLTAAPLAAPLTAAPLAVLPPTTDAPTAALPPAP